MNTQSDASTNCHWMLYVEVESGIIFLDCMCKACHVCLGFISVSLDW